MVNVEVLATDELGDRSYVAHDGQAAVVIDPQRDIDRVQSVLTELGLRCTLVLETHIHNDYVSGGLELAVRTGAAYVVAGTEEVAFDRRAVSDGDELAAGRMTVNVVATPGHTDGHLSYIVSDQEGSPVVFSGGSLLFGSVGRTDLVDPDRVHELTRAQYRSARRLVALVPDDTALYPTHGFGSFCSAGAAVGDSSSTIGLERQRNDALGHRRRGRLRRQTCRRTYDLSELLRPHGSAEPGWPGPGRSVPATRHRSGRARTTDQRR